MESTTEIQKPFSCFNLILLILSTLAWVASLIYTIYDCYEAGEHWEYWLTIFLFLTAYLLIEVFSYIVIIFQRKIRNEVTPELSVQLSSNCLSKCANSCKLKISMYLNFIIWTILFFLSIFRFNSSFTNKQLHEEIVFACVISYIKIRGALELYGFLILFIKAKGWICKIISPVVKLFIKRFKGKKLSKVAELPNISISYEDIRTHDNSPEIFEKNLLKKKHPTNDSGELPTFRV